MVQFLSLSLLVTTKYVNFLSALNVKINLPVTKFSYSFRSPTLVADGFGGQAAWSVYDLQDKSYIQFSDTYPYYQVNV